MSGFGGFCPLPIRLGGSATEGWAAVQHARAAADLTALCNVVPFAWITVSKSGATFSFGAYNGVNGSGVAHAPTPSSLGTGITRLTFDAVYEDEYSEPYSIAIRSARATVHSTSQRHATVVVSGKNTVDVYTFDSAGAAIDATFTVKVSSWVRPRRIGHYDGALDKHDVKTERVPYAWIWYNEYTAALGSAYTTAMSGLVHSRKLALARNEAGVQRAAEKTPNNARPGTADDMLGEWVAILHVRTEADDTRHEVRQRAAARFEATRGNSRTDVDEIVSSLLGDYFVRVWRSEGTDLANPPTLTYWPTINPGPSAYSLGGGAWASTRSHIVVEVKKPNTVNDDRFLHLVNVELFDVLDRILPAWATFNWATEFSDDGFNLDIDQLDFTGLTET